MISGAVQGSVFGPISVIMFIDDITEEVKAYVKLFVDNAKVKNKIKNEYDVEALQIYLDKLYRWEEEVWTR